MRLTSKLLLLLSVVVILFAGAVVSLRTLRARNQGYTNSYYEEVNRSAVHSAETAIPMVVQLVHPHSAVDVGSGEGYWTAALLKNGVPDVTAVDGPWVDRAQLKIPVEKFVVQDFSNSLQLARTFDMVLCLEVAEHLKPERAESFVADLTRLAPAIVFSAAIPGQGGTMHYNEEWPSYWAGIFARHGYDAIDVFRPALWNNQNISAMYRQNMFLYVRRDYRDSHADLKGLPTSPPESILNLVHPVVYENSMKNVAYLSRWQTKVKHFLGME